MGQHTVKVNGESVTLPWDQATVGQIKQFVGIPQERNLTVREDGQSQMLRGNEVVNLREGMNLFDAPRFRWGAPPIVRRLQQESTMLSAAVGCNVDWGQDVRADMWWVRVSKFPLPSGWNHAATQTMVTVPNQAPGYPVLPPDGFYLDRRLRDRHGCTPGHYFEERSNLNPFVDKGWAWFCIHVEQWSPSLTVFDGDSLVKYLGLVYDVLSQAVRQ